MTPETANQTDESMRRFRSRVALGVLIGGVLLPLLLLILGIGFNSDFLIGGAALLWGGMSFLIMATATPVVWAADMLVSLVEGGVGRVQEGPPADSPEPSDRTRQFLEGGKYIILAGLFTSFLAMLLPLHRNISAIPILVLGTIILGMSSGKFLNERTIRSVVGIVMAGTLFSLSFPQITQTVQNEVSDLFGPVFGPSRVEVECGEIEDIHFFGADQKSQLWLYQTGPSPDQWEWFDQAGAHPQYGDSLQAVRRQDVRRLVDYCQTQAQQEEARTSQPGGPAPTSQPSRREATPPSPEPSPTTNHSEIRNRFRQAARDEQRAQSWERRDIWEATLGDEHIHLYYHPSRVEAGATLAGRIRALGGKVTTQVMETRRDHEAAEKVFYPSYKHQVARTLRDVISDRFPLVLASEQYTDKVAIYLQ